MVVSNAPAHRNLISAAFAVKGSVIADKTKPITLMVVLSMSALQKLGCDAPDVSLAELGRERPDKAILDTSHNLDFARLLGTMK